VWRHKNLLVTRTFTTIIFKAVVEKKTGKKLEMSIFKIGLVNMLHPSVFWVDSLIVVSMAVQEGSNRHAV
jgi:hypothetical protein